MLHGLSDPSGDYLPRAQDLIAHLVKICKFTHKLAIKQVSQTDYFLNARLWVLLIKTTALDHVLILIEICNIVYEFVIDLVYQVIFF